MNCYWIEGNSEGDDRTRANTLQLLKQLLGRRVPVQAIGIESHLTAPLALGGEKYKQFLSEVRDLGLQILITELDINDTPIAGGVNTLDTAVAQAYTDYLKQFTGVTPLNAVIFWTPSDQFNWMNSAKDAGHKRSDGQQHRAGLFDSNMNPKLAFTSVNAALAQLCQR